MPRVGHNPLTNDSLPPLPGIIAAIITHLPNREGYHAQRFDVINRCIESLTANAERDLPLYIWDNGSDPEFRHYLAKDIKPDYLMLSPNIGKASARTAILRTWPPDTVICFSDDDILYNPDWLNPQLDLLYTFPDVGAVSGCPIRAQSRFSISSTLDWAQRNAEIDIGHHIPEEWEQEFCRSIGRDYQYHRGDTASDRDYLIRYKGMKAYAMAHHMQFICLAGRLSSLEYWPRQAMRAERSFDKSIDDLGLLRLTTTERHTQHIGNIMEL